MDDGVKYFQQAVLDPVRFLREGYSIRQHVGGAASSLFAALSQPQLLVRLSFIDVQIPQRKVPLVAVIPSYAGAEYLKKYCKENINIRASSDEEW